MEDLIQANHMQSLRKNRQHPDGGGVIPELRAGFFVSIVFLVPLSPFLQRQDQAR